MMADLLQESRKLMAAAAASLGNDKGSQRIFREFVDGLFGDPQSRNEKFKEMQDYYDKYIKDLEISAKKVMDGDDYHVEVSGLKETLNG